MKKIIFVPLLLLSSIAFAQNLTGLQLDKTTVLVGQAVQATVGLEGSGSNCGLSLDWGDSPPENIKIEKPDQMPFKASHIFKQAGEFKVNISGKKVTSHLPCVGKDHTVVVKVTAPAPAAAAPAAAAPAAAAPVAKASAPAPVAASSSCPEGWKLSAKSVNKKTKAFTCTAKPGTAIPAASIECPGDLSYFENKKKGMLGCRP